jgi:hypothetical protein
MIIYFSLSVFLFGVRHDLINDLFGFFCWSDPNTQLLPWKGIAQYMTHSDVIVMFSILAIVSRVWRATQTGYRCYLAAKSLVNQDRTYG